MNTFNDWLSGLIGKVLRNILEAAIERIDAQEWLSEYAPGLVEKLIEKFNDESVQGDLQEHVLDPIKAWLEEKLNINL